MTSDKAVRVIRFHFFINDVVEQGLVVHIWRLRQDYKFKINLAYLVSIRLTWALFQKVNKMKKILLPVIALTTLSILALIFANPRMLFGATSFKKKRKKESTRIHRG